MSDQFRPAGAGSQVGLWSHYISFQAYTYFQNDNSLQSLLKNHRFQLLWQRQFSESLLEGKQRSPRRTEVPKPTNKDDGQSYLALPQDPSDFLWLMTEEPHRTRRMEIMKAYPEVFFVRLDQCGTIDIGWFSGHEAHGPQAADKICRFGGRSAPTWSSNLSPTYPM